MSIHELHGDSDSGEGQDRRPISAFSTTATPPPKAPRPRPSIAASAGIGLLGGAVAGLAVFAISGQLAVQSLGTGPISTPGWTSVASMVAPSVVSVASSGKGSADEGSGVIWDTAGHVVTNDHVIANVGVGGKVQVELSDQRIYTATVVGADPTTDLAVLQIKDPPNGLEPIAQGVVSLRVGDPVMAIGNPLGLSGTVTTGIVSALDRPVATSEEGTPTNQPVVTDAIQTSAAVNPGNSGGALVDDQGVLVGINSAMASLGNSSQAGNIGIGFAIPTQEVDLIVPQLIGTGSAVHAYLGITTTDALVTLSDGSLSGAGVASVVAGGPSTLALQPGDVVTAVNGVPVSSTEALLGQIRALPVGQPVILTVYHGSTQRSVTITLGQNPQR